MSPGASKKMKSAPAREKHLNVSTFWMIEEGAVNRTRDKAIRISIVLTTIVAWLSISNHCAVGAMVAAKTQPSMAQMHCHGTQPAPSKKSGDEEMPCCKVLRATLAGQGKIVQVASKDFFPIQRWIVAEIIFADEAQLHRPAQELDTGPPFAGSFAESVLQRSILAHAPPSLA
jgi:hypothetical protein